MATVIADDLKVCEDCAGLIANDEATPEHRAHVEAMDLGSEGEGTWVLTCSGDDEESCDTFSTVPCDSCGSGLAGSRHTAAILGN